MQPRFIKGEDIHRVFHAGKTDLGDTHQMGGKSLLIFGHLTVHEKVGAEMAAKLLQTIGDGKTRPEFGHSRAELCLNDPAKQDSHTGRCQASSGDGFGQAQGGLQGSGANSRAVFPGALFKNNQAAVARGGLYFQGKIFFIMEDLMDSIVIGNEEVPDLLRGHSQGFL